MLDELLRHLSQIGQADTLIGQLWLKLLARRIGLYALASLVGTLGLGMANLGFYLAFVPSVGPVWAAALLATIDFVVAFVIVVISASANMGANGDAAVRARETAIEAIDTDTAELRATVRGLREDVQEIRATVTTFVHNPIDAATQKLLIPAAMSVLNGLRTPKSDGT